jgi:hypothetical protein
MADQVVEAGVVEEHEDDVRAAWSHGPAAAGPFGAGGEAGSAGEEGEPGELPSVQGMVPSKVGRLRYTPRVR